MGKTAKNYFEGDRGLVAFSQTIFKVLFSFQWNCFFLLLNWRKTIVLIRISPILSISQGCQMDTFSRAASGTLLEAWNSQRVFITVGLAHETFDLYPCLIRVVQRFIFDYCTLTLPLLKCQANFPFCWLWSQLTCKSFFMQDSVGPWAKQC